MIMKTGGATISTKLLIKLSNVDVLSSVILFCLLYSFKILYYSVILT
jgi:hypothetical protein